MATNPIGDLGAARARRTLPAVMLEATILDPPLSVEGYLRVQVDAQKGRARECPWTPRPDDEPAPGDAALVCESDQGNVWVVTWWPQ